ncbi:hypothetical protein RHGRI_032367 [Rhododendron griersonianum]|uniref:Uncharacterized protein n=1 Tax=Rhododendron griersonianum TaxID=479676 RepID=A0AAV6IGE0_9ERIC|nr:hypothetical protein RHGRI_032367 [Rhododendron griersonianum]
MGGSSDRGGVGSSIREELGDVRGSGLGRKESEEHAREGERESEDDEAGDEDDIDDEADEEDCNEKAKDRLQIGKERLLGNISGVLSAGMFWEERATHVLASEAQMFDFENAVRTSEDICAILPSVGVVMDALSVAKSWLKMFEPFLDRRRRRRPPEVQQGETHDQFLDQDHGPVMDHPVWPSRTVELHVINSIPTCKYRSGDGLVEGTECSVYHTPIAHCAVPESLATPGGFQRRCRGRVLIIQGLGRKTKLWFLRLEVNSGGKEKMRIEEGEREVENREKGIETPEEDVVHQPKRRSMSMDSVYASMTNACQGEIAGSSGSQTRKTNESSVDIVPDSVDANRSILKFVGGSSIGRSPQKGPISMERSLSCSGKG